VITLDSLDSAFDTLERSARSDSAQVELLVDRSYRFSASFQKGKPENYVSASNQCAGLRVIADGFEGYSFSENFSPEALSDAYQEALANARLLSAHRSGVHRDQNHGPELLAPQSDSEPRSGSAQLNLYSDSLAALPIDEKLARARALEASGLAVDQRIVAIPYSGYSEVTSETLIYNSRGMRRRQLETAATAHVYCLAKSGDESRMAGETFFSRSTDAIDTQALAVTAAHEALAKLGATTPKTGTYAVVLDAKVASEFIALLAGSFSAKAVDEKQSLLTGRLGERVFSSIFNWVDDPFVEDGVATRTFDSEGALSRRVTLIQDGVLKNYLTNSTYAARLNLPHTASAERSARSELGIGYSNLVVQPGQQSLEDLLSSHQEIVYITHFTGYHAGYQDGSGDFSLQSEGELWQNGKRVSSLAGFVTAGNILDVLKSAEAVSSRRLSPTQSVIAPDILIPAVSIAGAYG
jgi:PmbA protein